jgi:hypothetical protein
MARIKPRPPFSFFAQMADMDIEEAIIRRGLTLKQQGRNLFS